MNSKALRTLMSATRLTRLETQTKGACENQSVYLNSLWHKFTKLLRLTKVFTPLPFFFMFCCLTTWN